MNINARGCRIRQFETSLPFDGIIRIRFIGYDLNRATAQYPRCYLINQSLRQAQRPSFFHQTHLIEPLPTLAGKVNLTVLRIVSNSVQHIRVSITQ